MMPTLGPPEGLLKINGPFVSRDVLGTYARMYVRMSVCLYVCVCMYLCMYAWMYVCKYVMYVGMHVCLCVTHVCMYVCMYVCMHAYMHVCTYVCMYVYVYMYVCMHAYMHVCMYVCVCVCVKYGTLFELFGTLGLGRQRLYRVGSHVKLLSNNPSIRCRQDKRIKHSQFDGWPRQLRTNAEHYRKQEFIPFHSLHTHPSTRAVGRSYAWSLQCVQGLGLRV